MPESTNSEIKEIRDTIVERKNEAIRDAIKTDKKCKKLAQIIVEREADARKALLMGMIQVKEKNDEKNEKPKKKKDLKK